MPSARLGLIVIALACFVYAMNASVLNVAVPALSARLNPTPWQLLWIVDIYGFSLASMLITMGRLGDRVGRRRLLLCGVAAFGVFSILAAFSKTAGALIASRAVLGVAGAALAPSTLSLIRNMFQDSHDRAVAIGVWVASYSAGSAIGPVLGGLALEYFWWGSIFLITVPVIVLILVLGPVLLPEFRNPDAKEIDLPSVPLSLAAVLTLVYGLKGIAANGFAWRPAVCVVMGLSVGYLFFRRQAYVIAPMIDIRVFRTPAFIAALATYASACFVTGGSLFFVAQYMQLVLGLKPFQVGLWTLPVAAGAIIGSALTPHLARRMTPDLLTAGSITLAAIGFMVLSFVDRGTAPATVAAARCMCAFGLGPVCTLATHLIVGSVPANRAGEVSAICETCSEFGGAFGIAVLGSIGTSVYRVTLSGTDVGAKMTAATLGAAMKVALQTGGAPREAALSLTRAAFVGALHVTTLISSVGLLILAICVVRWFPSLRLRGPQC